MLAQGIRPYGGKQVLKANVVRCKFRCNSMTKQVGWDATHPILYTYKFNAVVSGSEENKQFWAATPNGSLEVSGIADDLFEIAEEYYLDLFQKVLDEVSEVQQPLLE